MLRGVLELATGRNDEALEVMERVMSSNPRDDTLLSMCASLKKDLGVPGWRSLAQRVVDRGEDADAVRLAEELLAGPTADLNKRAVPSTDAAMANLRFAAPS